MGGATVVLGEALVTYKVSEAVSGKIAGRKGVGGAGSTDVLSNKTFTNSTSKVHNYTSPNRGLEAAQADFNSLKPTNVRTAPNGSILGDLPNGATINIHMGKSVGGAPTLEIPDPTTGVSIKIRY